MPSVQSLQQQEYYAHPQNRFWKIMERLSNRTLIQYADKLAVLKAYNIGLWDVIEQCERKGSLDGNIRNAQCNAIMEFCNRYPNIQYILCNGKMSYTLLEKQRLQSHISIISMPSTSSANCKWKQEELLQYWKETIETCISNCKQIY